MNIAIIPARGGSKRIPQKNIKPFLGKPIIAYSIEAAQKSNLFDRIIVSTDDEAIAQTAKLYGAEIPFLRPKELADDFAPTVPVIAHAIKTLQSQTNQSINTVCCLYATAPFTNQKFLTEGYKKLIGERRDYVFSATRFSFPIWRAFALNKEDNVEMFWPENYNTRSQDLPPAYQDAGQFYWGTPQAFLEEKPFFSSNASIIELPSFMVQDIDTFDDWKLAELMFKALQHEHLI